VVAKCKIENQVAWNCAAQKPDQSSKGKWAGLGIVENTDVGSAATSYPFFRQWIPQSFVMNYCCDIPGQLPTHQAVTKARPKVL
jgi:hypothetical protein